MNYKTSKKDFKQFQKYVMQWVNTLGLHDWRIEFSHELAEGMRAFAVMALDARGAVIGLSTIFDVKPTNEVLKSSALHEVMHLVTTPLLERCKDRNTPSNQLEEDEHKIIRLFESLQRRGKLKP